MIRVGIVGSTGLVGECLIRAVLGHPDARLSFLGSDSSAGQKIQNVFPSLTGLVDLACEKPQVDRLTEACDVVFLASKSPEVMAFVPPLLQAGKKVIDIGAEFRLNSADVYERWYKAKHLCPELLPAAVYGLPELNRDRIRGADLIANPGCYATVTILALSPLLREQALVPGPIPVDAFSGLSGAGRTATGTNLFVQCNENVRGYKLNEHRHAPEIEQEISRVAGSPQRVLFLPHTVPLDRGIYCTCFVETRRRMSRQELLGILRQFYQGERFIRIHEDPANVDLLSVRDTNFCDIGVLADPESNRVILISALDNMIKGAAGQAVQNMNLLFGVEETTGLLGRRMY